MIPLRNFDELRQHDFSMGLEGVAGLCNAVVVGAPNTSFIHDYAALPRSAFWLHVHGNAMFVLSAVLIALGTLLRDMALV